MITPVNPTCPVCGMTPTHVVQLVIPANKKEYRKETGVTITPEESHFIFSGDGLCKKHALKLCSFKGIDQGDLSRSIEIVIGQGYLPNYAGIYLRAVAFEDLNIPPPTDVSLPIQ